jgi:chromosome segregation ATPase
MGSVNRPTLAGLQAQLEALRHNMNLVETERDSLRMKLDDRTNDLVRLNDAYSVITTRLDVAERQVQSLRAELEAAQRPAASTVSAAAQISERRAAMRRAREEAMQTGRFVKAW